MISCIHPAPFSLKTSWGKLAGTLYVRKRDPHEFGNLREGCSWVVAVLIVVTLGAMGINAATALITSTLLLPNF